jgi:ABC-type Mn2+/Zn2+ transport system ATPase subunit
MSFKLTLTDAAFRYSESASLCIQPISLTIEPSNRLAIIGKNGSGKTTLLKLLAGIYLPSQGTRCSSARVGWKSCQLPHYCPFSLDDILRLHPHSFHPDTTAIESIITEFELESLRHIPFEKLSTGEQHRILIARLFVAQYDVIIIDEPLTGLDPRQQAKLGQRLFAFSQTGGAVIVASHELRWVAAHFDQVLAVKESRLQHIDPIRVLDHGVLAIYD